MGWLKRVSRPLIFGFCGALAVWAGSLLIPDRYTSTALIRLDVEPFPAADVINIAYRKALSRRDLKSLIERLNLYSGERERLPLEDVIDTAKKDAIGMEILPNHDVRVSFTYHEPDAAKAAAEAIMNRMVEAADDLSRREPGWGRLEIRQAVGSAEAVSTLAFWRRSRYTAKGTMAVKKLDSFVVDKDAAEKRSESLKQSALSRETFVVLMSSLGLDELQPDNLHIDRTENVLKISFTDTDASRAKKVVSRLITLVVDEYAIQPDHQPVAVNSHPSEIDPKIAALEPGSLRPDFSGFMTSSIAKSFSAGSPLPPRKRERKISLLDPGSQPEEADGPSRTILSIFGFFLGVGLWTALKT